MSRHPLCAAAMLLALSVSTGCVSGEALNGDRQNEVDPSWEEFGGTGGGHTVVDQIPMEVVVKRASLSAQPRVPAIDSTFRVLEQAAALPAELLVPVTIDFADVPLQGTDHGRSEGARLAFLEARREAVEALQAPARAWLESSAARDIQMSWIVNQARAKVPAKLVANLPMLPNVSGVSLAVPNLGAPLVAEGSGEKWGLPFEMAPAGGIEATVVGSGSLHEAYDGLSSRRSTLVQAMLEERMDGRTGNRLDSDDPVRIGIFEASMLNYQHLGWRKCGQSWCTSRLVKRKDCNQFPCVDATAPPASDDPHGTIVSYVAAGGIEEGQDPAYPGSSTTAQTERSGHLPNASVYFYTGMGSDSISNAIQQSIVDGIDVLNLSLRWGPECDGSFDASGMNQALKTARSLGVLVTACAGNSGADACTTWYPAVRTDTVAVNGLDTSDSDVEYAKLGILPDASRGGMPIRLFSGWTGESRTVDLSAPGTLRLYAAHQGKSGYEQSGASGCSVATPVVSAAAGAMKGAFRAMGLPTDSAELLMVNMLLMGDGWDPDIGKQRRTGLSELSGAGRIRMHWYDELIQPAGWGAHSFRIYDGETHAFSVGSAGPESPSIQQWKWAGLWFEDDLQQVADIDFFVYDTCPPGGGEVVIAKDVGFGLRTRFTLLGPEIRNRCLEMRVVGTAVPSEGRQVWLADYFHSGDPQLH
jgi:Subtilase family